MYHDAFTQLTQDAYLLPDDDPSVTRYLKELLAERTEEKGEDKAAKQSWQSLHMSVAEKRASELLVRVFS